MKNIIIWSCVIIIPFIGFVAALYFSKEHILKFTNKNYASEYAENQLADTAESDSVNSSKPIDPVTNAIMELLNLQNEHVTKIKEQTTTIKQQEKKIEELTATIEELKRLRTIEISNQDKKRIQDLAKTLGSMKQEAIKPILANLPDEIIKLLYDSAKSKDKAKIFNAMPPARAGRLMRKLAENNNKDK